jgi:hypothetical protein
MNGRTRQTNIGDGPAPGTDGKVIIKMELYR